MFQQRPSRQVMLRLGKYERGVAKLREQHIKREEVRLKKRREALQEAKTLIKKKTGETAITSHAKEGAPPSVQCIPIRRQAISDIMTGARVKGKTIPGSGRGLPRGRVIEIYGPESSGKTTLVIEWMIDVQRTGGVVAFVDVEHALDIDYARSLGLDVDDEDRFMYYQPDSAEAALDIIDMLSKSGGVDLIAVDSVAALTPRAETEGKTGDYHVGLHARLMSQALRKITARVSKNNVVMVFINQTRMKIGVRFGNPETTTGGNALRFYASIRFDIRRVETLKKGKDEIGIRSRLRAIKNKVAPPFGKALIDIFSGEGIVKSYLDDPNFVPVKGRSKKDDEDEDEE